jgi:hypothetical protein
MLKSIEVGLKGHWKLIQGIQLDRPLRSAGAVPFENSFIIFGGYSAQGKDVEPQNFAWHAKLDTKEMIFFGRVQVRGAFSAC